MHATNAGVCRQGGGSGTSSGWAAAAPDGGGGRTFSGAAVARHCSCAARPTRGRALEARRAGATLPAAQFRAAAVEAMEAMLDACVDCQATGHGSQMCRDAPPLRQGLTAERGLLSSLQAVTAPGSTFVCQCTVRRAAQAVPHEPPRGLSLRLAACRAPDRQITCFPIAVSPTDRFPIAARAMGTARPARPAGALLPLLLLLCGAAYAGEPSRCSSCRAVAVSSGGSGGGRGGGVSGGTARSLACMWLPGCRIGQPPVTDLSN